MAISTSARMAGMATVTLGFSVLGIASLAAGAGPPNGVAMVVTGSEMDLTLWATLLASAGAVALVLSEGFRALLMSMLPMYSRISQDEVLDHPMRQEIYEYIEKNPGVNFSTMMKKLDLKNGVLAYHLKTLEKADFIRSLRQGPFRIYYSRNTRDIPEELSSRILYAIKSNPGVFQGQLAKSLSESRQVINYHVNRLIREGKVWYRLDGRRILLYARYNV